jgi:hypothetical protein
VPAVLARLTGAKLTSTGRLYTTSKKGGDLHPFTSKWSSADLTLVNLPTKDAITECDMKDCSSWVVPPDSMPKDKFNLFFLFSGLPEPIKKIIGNLDLREDTKMFPEMRKKLKDPSMSASILTHYLQPTVQVLSVSETRLYPLAQYLLMAGGMNFQNNFHITYDVCIFSLVTTLEHTMILLTNLNTTLEHKN